MIDRKDYLNIVSQFPIPATDLIIVAGKRVLVGKRSNTPAQGEWFVPGGRVKHGETISNALDRIWRKEISERYMPVPRFIGVFEHFYSAEGDFPDSHFIVQGFVFPLPSDHIAIPKNMVDQHQDTEWVSFDDKKLHKYVKLYLERLR